MNAPNGLQVVRSCVDALTAVRSAQRQGLRVGLVPTMGALHEGHLSLVRRSRSDCGFTAVSIFVNPTQFAPHEDLAAYPRTWEQDVVKLRRLGVDLVFAPANREMYPPGSTTFVDPPQVAATLEGERRPEHFRGVATIVLKLFQVLPADIAYFGHKDYQQTLVIRHMVEDLLTPIEIEVCPTVREADGLALSSRNVYLSATERQQALAISRSLRHAQQRFIAGTRSAAELKHQMRSILEAAGLREIDYLAVVDAHTLQEVAQAQEGAVVLIAARVGATRLIDNAVLRQQP